jgi:histidinol-phosphate aminotransferase
MSCDFLNLANPGVRDLAPYQPGKPIEELERELGVSNIIKLASNENPLGAGHAARQAARQSLESLHLYPDGSGFRLKHALAERLGVSVNSLTLGNGSNDLLELMARAFLARGDEAIFSEHGFAIYPLVIRASSATPVQVPAHFFGHDLEAMADAITERTRIIFVANPNNPTGTWFHKAVLEAFLARVPERVLVVLDEAYFEYVEEDNYPNGLDFIGRYPNVIVLRTFSKIHGLAALRVGYGVSHPDLADVLNRVRQPFNCNSVGLAAAEAALDDEDHVQDSMGLNATGLAQLVEGCEALGLSSIPSVANFLAIDCEREAAPVYQALLREGIIVRPIAGYGLPQHLRVTVGLPEENERFLTALARVLQR